MRISRPLSHPHAELLETRALLSSGGQSVPGAPGTDASVAGRYIFFNHSAFDGNDPVANASDDAAVSPAVAALLPGQRPALVNVSNYSRGLNGVMVDVNHLAPGGSLSADDFAFRLGNDAANPNGWPAAPAPASISVRRGAGVGGSDRVSLTWPDGALRNAWLQVSVLDTPDTGLSAPDVFYFGSLPGDAGTGGVLPSELAGPYVAAVSQRDFVATRRRVRPRRPVDASSPVDNNRDGRVNARDLLVVRQNLLSRLEPLQSPDLPPTYFVSPGGDDSADGRSPLSAWRTAAKVNSTAFVPGAHVLFQRGGEWHEQLVVSSSGTPESPVVFGSYGTGLKPKFWGSDPLQAAGFEPVAGADSTYRILPAAPVTVNSIQADHAFFRSAPLAAGRSSDPAASMALLKSTPRTWYQDPSSGALYVHTAGDDPRSGLVLYNASVRDNVVLVQNRHDVVVRNFVVDESAKDGGGYAFAVGESSNVTIEASEAYRAGKHHFGAINTDNFVGRHLYSAWAMPDQGYGAASAYVSYSQTSVPVTGPGTRSAWFDCVYDEVDGVAAPYMVFYTHGNNMGDITLEDMDSNGGLGLVLATEGRDQHVQVRGGHIVNGGLMLYGDNTVVDGLTVRGTRAGAVLVGSGNVLQNVVIDAATFMSGDAGALVNYGHDNVVRFSTIRVDAAPWPGAAVVLKTRSGAGPRIYANVIDATRAFRVDPGAVTSFTSDHNLFAREPAFVRSDGSVRTLAQWRTDFGQDGASFVADPLFANAAAGDLSLLPGSPAADAFTPTDILTGVPADALGLPRPRGTVYDLGAYERQA